jgi:hypothetical protein
MGLVAHRQAGENLVGGTGNHDQIMMIVVGHKDRHGQVCGGLSPGHQVGQGDGGQSKHHPPPMRVAGHFLAGSFVRG